MRCEEAVAFAAYCVECLLKRGICKRGKADHQFNVVPIVSFASTTGLLSSLYWQRASEQ